MTPASSKSEKGLVAPKRVLVGIAAVVILLVIALVTTIYFTVRNNIETEEILIDSVKTELVASCIGAREIMKDNIELFNMLNSKEDVLEHWNEWVAVVEELRALNNEIGSEYIYVLKELDGVYYFVFDTDPEIQASRDVFLDYELSPVHERAFGGEASADVMNVEDEWGTFNTGAIPFFDTKGNQIGIVSTDISDSFIQRNKQTTTFYSTSLIAVTSVSVVVMLVILFMLIRRNARMQSHLFSMANYDPISGLPNRNSLFSYLSGNIDFLRDRKHPFVVFFVDLDNFKSVNDNAGHDAGDDLLREIGVFLSKHAEKSVYASSDAIMDPLTARIGGDEFLQLLPSVASKEEASTYAQSLLDEFAMQPKLKRFIDEFSVGLSIGVALFPSMSTDYDELIKFADIAMYYAKKNGKNHFRVYDVSMGDDVEDAELSVRKQDRD